LTFNKTVAIKRRGMGMKSAGKTVLVVDDDPGVLDYASNVLEEFGYGVLTAPDGATALVLLRNHAQVDLLFTDIVMPGLDGVEVARRACEEHPGLKVLFTSGYAANAIPAGRLLKKPYRPQQLAGEIAAMLDE
jgi:CheY-like chemotaxis protein